VLAKLPQSGGADLLVGHSTADDAAVLKIDGRRALVQTVDFFTPIVDDPRLFGAIAAANSISDIYAMGAEPILGLAIAAFPTAKLPLEVLEEIMAGGAGKAAEAGFPIAGGHTIIDDVPKYGLAVTGIADADRIVRNSTAREGDSLYLTKPVGNGILVCAYRALSNGGALRRMTQRKPPQLDEAIEWMLLLNRDAARVMVEHRVNAATDVTGYGLLGHLLEMCDGAGLGARIHAAAVPLLGEVRDNLRRGYLPDGTRRNMDTFRPRVRSSVPEEDFTILCDAQTSGGLLIAVSREGERAFVSGMEESGLLCAKVGEMTGTGGPVEVLP
jgi:selenide,water dikinase